MLRNITLASALAVLTATQAQPFTFVIEGSLPDCSPNSIIDITDLFGGTYAIAVLDGTCSFTATVEAFLPAGELTFLGTCANGSQAVAQQPYQFATPGDTLSFNVVLTCGAPITDCLGVTGGGALPGAPCDDANDGTLLDSWGADCQCVGVDTALVVYDCAGIPNGPNQPGTPCIVDPAFPVLPIGIWSSDCQCVADSSIFNYTDCQGVVNGPALTGTPCDDGNASTAIDLWDASCQCIGYDSTAVTFDCLGMAFGGNLPGTPCIVDSIAPVFPIGIWSTDCECIPDTLFGTIYDCQGIANGPNMPGSSCDDGDANTVGDAWDFNCQCLGSDTTSIADCLGLINGPNNPGTPCLDPSNPFGIGYWDLDCTCVVDTTNAPLDCLGIPGGPNMPGLPCSLLPDSSNTVVGIWGPDCICYANTFDCLGTPGGGNLPGTSCTGTAPDGSTYTGMWDTNCFCANDTIDFPVDCLGQLNGPNLPGTPCIPLNEFPFAPIGSWSADCQCIPDSSLFYIDCLGIENGPNTIGSICDTGDPNVLGYWNSDCACEAYTMPPCTAGFLVMPGIIDTTGTDPMQLWIFNTSYGGTGIYTYLWDFGDGGTSTDPWPMHDYDGFGPYLLCLTITDDAGCTSSYCDTLVVDENGLFGGLLGDGERSSGFSIRVMAGEAPTSMAEAEVLQDMALWPNPAVDRVNITLNSTWSGPADIMVLDVDGRVVWTDRRALTAGENRLELATDQLPTGMYLVRVITDRGTRSGRFVKADR